MRSHGLPCSFYLLLCFLSDGAAAYLSPRHGRVAESRKITLHQTSSFFVLPRRRTSLFMERKVLKNEEKQQQTTATRRVLIPPAPQSEPLSNNTRSSNSKSKATKELEQLQKRRQDQKVKARIETKETTTIPKNNAMPNWIFAYPRQCSCLLNSALGGAHVGPLLDDNKTMIIPPDSCQGGYYGHDEKLDPKHVLIHGMSARGENYDLLNHVLQGPESAFRGTTKQIVYPEDGVGAASFAGEGGYVYEVTCVPSWDVNKHLQGRRKTSNGVMGNQKFGGNLVLGEHEHAIPSRVPPQHIKRYGRVVRSAAGTLFVPRAAWVENPNWNPAFCKYSISDAACSVIQALLKELDQNNNGVLDLEEFQALMLSLNDNDRDDGLVNSHDDDGTDYQHDIRLLFERFDKDKSGAISATELREFLMHQNENEDGY